MALGKHEKMLVDRALKALGEEGSENQIPNIVRGIIANEHLPPSATLLQLEDHIIRKTKEAFRAHKIDEAIKAFHARKKR